MCPNGLPCSQLGRDCLFLAQGLSCSSSLGPKTVLEVLALKGMWLGGDILTANAEGVVEGLMRRFRGGMAGEEEVGIKERRVDWPYQAFPSLQLCKGLRRDGCEGGGMVGRDPGVKATLRAGLRRPYTGVECCVPSFMYTLLCALIRACGGLDCFLGPWQMFCKVKLHRAA